MSSKKRELYVQAQKRLIGCILADDSEISRILELITEADIEEPSYQLIFSAIAELARTNVKISQMSVGSVLESRGQLAKVGGPQELFSLAAQGERFLLEAPIEIYAKIIKESSAKSKIHSLLSESLVSFQDDSGVAAVDAVSDMQSHLNEKLLTLSDSSTISKFASGFDEFIEELAERKRVSEENASSEGLQGIPSLLPSLNRYTNGWSPGELITVAAKTGIGKSVMAINCAIAAAKANKAVMFFSLEMSKSQLENRIYSATTGIHLNKLKSGYLSADDYKILRDQQKAMESMKIIIDTEPKITVDGIRAKALRQAQSAEGLDMLIIDYMSLITPVGRFSSRQEAVADISRNMKLLAKQLNVPVMILAQLNREAKEETGGIPTLESIRESGAIAHDSDVVILLHRDQSEDETIPHTLVILAKNRDGENNKTIRTHSNLECSLFREVARVKDIEALTEDDDSDIIDDLDLANFDEDEYDFGSGDLEDL